MPAEDRAEPTRRDPTRRDPTRRDLTRRDPTKLSVSMRSSTLLDASLLDASLLDALAARLARASAATLEASHELLAHYADTGDPSSQRAVDLLIHQTADALGALTDSLTETSRELVAAAARATTPQPGESSPARTGRKRGPNA